LWLVYALDRSGFVHPFPRDLSIRSFENAKHESDVPAEYFDGKGGGNRFG
jgi:hypothetical protein